MFNSNYNNSGGDALDDTAENRPLLLQQQQQDLVADAALLDEASTLNIELATTPTVMGAAAASNSSYNTSTNNNGNNNSDAALDAQLQADLQNLSRGEIKDVMSLFTNLDDNNGSVPKKNEVIEGTVIHFSNMPFFQFFVNLVHY